MFDVGTGANNGFVNKITILLICLSGSVDELTSAHATLSANCGFRGRYSDNYCYLFTFDITM